MAKATGLSAATILRIWRTNKLKPHLTQTFTLSNDPQFVEKVRDIVRLYLSRPDTGLFLSVDHKSRIQALDRTQHLLAMGKGYPDQLSYDYVRHETAAFPAPFSVMDGRVIGSVRKQQRHQDFLASLKRINRETPGGLDLHLVVDNYGMYRQPVVRSWPASRTPTILYPLHAQVLILAESRRMLVLRTDP